MTLPGGWLDSGDLAYVADGEVFIAGRQKDLIIKAGRNLVPQEIEEVAATVDGVRKGCVVAFGVSNEALAHREPGRRGRDARRTDAAARDQIVAAIIERVAAAVGVPPDSVVAAPPGAIPKTSSGKVRRSADEGPLPRGAPSAARRPRPLRQRLRLLAAGLRGARAGCASRRSRGARYAVYVAVVLAALALLVWPLAALLPSRGRREGPALEAPCASPCAPPVAASPSRAPSTWPDGGPCLLASNHTSYADIGRAPRRPSPRTFVFVAKKEVLAGPSSGSSCVGRGTSPVDRADAQDGVAAAAKRGPRPSRPGESVLVFPEATFTAAAGLRPFRLGAFKTAVETGYPRRSRGDPRRAPGPARRHLRPSAGPDPRLGRGADRPPRPRAGEPWWTSATASRTRSRLSAASRASTSWPRAP